MQALLDDEWIEEISIQFEELAQAEYKRLYRKYTNNQGQVIREFKKMTSTSDLMDDKDDLRSHPIEIDYDDFEDLYPMPTSKGDLIEYETEQ